jgi:hypothetical protein
MSGTPNRWHGNSWIVAISGQKPKRKQTLFYSIRAVFEIWQSRKLFEK